MQLLRLPIARAIQVRKKVFVQTAVRIGCWLFINNLEVDLSLVLFSSCNKLIIHPSAPRHMAFFDVLGRIGQTQRVNYDRCGKIGYAKILHA